MKTNRAIIFLSVFTMTFAQFSCVKLGCIDEGAANYDSKADEDDESCVYNNRTFGFYTNSTIGGDIYIELSNTLVDDPNYGYGYYYNDEGIKSSSAEFNYHASDQFYPECSISDLAYFERKKSSTYYYDAHDKDGNVWSGTVSAADGVCKLVEIYRDPAVYGNLHIYSSVDYSMTNFAVNVVPNPKGSTSDDPRRIALVSQELLSSTLPACGSGIGRILNVKAGSILLAVEHQGRKSRVSVSISSKGCTLFDVAPYLNK